MKITRSSFVALLATCLLGGVGILLYAGRLVSVDARSPEPVFFHRKLEPRAGVVLHGAGQTDDATFREYTLMTGVARPMLYMTYTDLKDDLPAFFRSLAENLDRYPDFLIPQIGLSLNAGSATGAYEQAVADGGLDERIKLLCVGLESLHRPVFLRIGYEFNGSWNGYDAGPYVAAFRKIAGTLKTCSPTTAAVWDYAPDGDPADPMSFYPGDAYVDWWAINLFSPDDFDSRSTRRYMQLALTHRFPVMIAESTPRGVVKSVALDTWFRPYFRFIRTHPEVKAFCYINWDWRKYPQWADWGDARIEDNLPVQRYFLEQLKSQGFRAAGNRGETLSLLGVNVAGR